MISISRIFNIINISYMDTTRQLAQQLRQTFLGKNWTAVSLEEAVSDISWQEANAQIYDLNTISKLFYHIGYYISGVLHFLEKGSLEIRDKYAFDHPPIDSEEDWEKLKAHTWKEVESLAQKIEETSPEKLSEVFVDEKYGNYFRNFLGIIEHSYYHLGQIVLIKKILRHQK